MDFTEVPLEKPSLAKSNSQVYRNYKGRPTIKCLVGITPGGTSTKLNFIYPLLLSHQFTVEQESETKKVANARIHVERVIGRTKEFKILQGPLPLSMLVQVDKPKC